MVLDYEGVKRALTDSDVFTIPTGTSPSAISDLLERVKGFEFASDERAAAGAPRAWPGPLPFRFKS